MFAPCLMLSFNSAQYTKDFTIEKVFNVMCLSFLWPRLMQPNYSRRMFLTDWASLIFRGRKRCMGETWPASDRWPSQTITRSLSVSWYTREYCVIYWGLQDFLRSYDSAPRPPPSSPLPSVRCLSFSVFLCVSGRAYWREGGGWGGGEEPNHATARKPDPL